MPSASPSSRNCWPTTRPSRRDPADRRSCQGGVAAVEELRATIATEVVSVFDVTISFSENTAIPDVAVPVGDAPRRFGSDVIERCRREVPGSSLAAFRVAAGLSGARWSLPGSCQVGWSASTSSRRTTSPTPGSRGCGRCRPPRDVRVYAVMVFAGLAPSRRCGPGGRPSPSRWDSSTLRRSTPRPTSTTTSS